MCVCEGCLFRLDNASLCEVYCRVRLYLYVFGEVLRSGKSACVLVCIVWLPKTVYVSL